MEEEKPRKKFVNRNVAIALGAVCIALAVGMVAVCFYQGNIINEKASLYDAYTAAHTHNDTSYDLLQAQYANYQATHSHSDEEYDALQAAYGNYSASHNRTNSEYESLQSAYEAEQASLNATQTEYNTYKSSHNHTDAEYNALQGTYDSYASSHTHSNTEYDSLQTAYDNYSSSHSHSNTEYDSLQATYSDYAANHTHSNTEYDNLQTTYNGYVTNHTYTNAEYDAQTAQIASLQAPQLVKVELVGTDERPAGQAYLNVVGYVCNVGSNTARNSRIHVLAYQSGGIVAIDTYIEMGAIAGSGYHYVSNIEVPYNGNALVSWALIPEWTT